MLRFGLAIVGLVALAGAANAQDVKNGENIFKKCRVCHQVGEGAKNVVGPELNGLIGRKSGMAPGYNYSSANKSSGVTWDEETFAKYIADPRKFMPGTKMAFAGIKDPADIKDLTAFLKQYGADGKKK